MSSSGPDDGRAGLQVAAGHLKHCVASGYIPEATLLLEAIGGRKREFYTHLERRPQRLF
jgi:hypothetical protein